LVKCAELTAGHRRLLLLSCHTPGFGPERLRAMLGEALGDDPPGAIEAGPLEIRTPDGRTMPCGSVVRWHCSG